MQDGATDGSRIGLQRTDFGDSTYEKVKTFFRILKDKTLKAKFIYYLSGGRSKKQPPGGRFAVRGDFSEDMIQEF